MASVPPTVVPLDVILLGPPGSGKGTQAQLLAQRAGVPQISTGDILRAAAAAGTPIGRRAKQYMEAGKLVPDEVVIGIAQERIAQPDCARGFILDGFPRTLPQAEALEKTLQAAGRSVLIVLDLDVDDQQVTRRISGRRVCSDPSCAAVYHVDTLPSPCPLPEGEGRVRERRCPECGAGLVQRADDAEEAVRQRLRVYHGQTEPLIDYYESRGVLRRVNGEGDIEEVARRVWEALQAAAGGA